MNVLKLVMALTAFFALTIIFSFFDPVISGTLYPKMLALVGDNVQAQTALGRFDFAWNAWVPGFIVAILIYAVSAGWDDEKPQ